MTARVLVVDDILANVRLLEAKLTAEYFEVHTAMNGVDALESVQRVKPDIVLLDVMMPGMDGIEVCRRIKGNPQTHHIPVVMVTALDQPDDRVRGLEAGADDFLTKPVSDLALFCRVKSLVRLKMLTDELRSRAAAGESMGLVKVVEQDVLGQEPGKILLIDNRNNLLARIKGTIGKRHEIKSLDDPQLALFEATENGYELIIVNLDFDNFDGLRLCSQLRSLERTRQVPILIIVDPDDHERLLRALDMGVNDYLLRPVDKQELMARVNTQIKRWRYTEQLRSNVKQSIEMAVTDALTGLYNRRFMEKQLSALTLNAANRGKPLSLLVVDVDYFKSINDNHGHDVGDRVLQELAARLREGLRNLDLPCRTGGEEFIVVLPDTDKAVALRVGERVRKLIGAKPFNAGAKSGPLTITVSIGVASFEAAEDTMESLLKRGDEALYQAKREGRNRVIPAAA
ncbi:MAG TPA: PleD family two-component system response regulator [Aestuariivirgaceae bacterium]|nr:PleD family two-component system response regulator [Aestuariivirgaceae bacterium]